MARGVKALSPVEMQGLAELAQLDEDYRSARRTLRAAVEAELGRRLEALATRRARKALDLARSGVPKTRIATALGTRNMNTVYDVLRRAEEIAAPETPRVFTHPFDAVMRVVDFDDRLIEIDVRAPFRWDERSGATLGVQSGRFRQAQAPGGLYWEPADDESALAPMAKDLGGQRAKAGYSPLAADVNGWFAQKKREHEESKR